MAGVIAITRLSISLISQIQSPKILLYVGDDGPTHNGCFDISFMRCLPNMVSMVPADENECRQMLYTGIQVDGPASVRYPRGGGPGVEVEK